MYVRDNLIMQFNSFFADPALLPRCLVFARMFCLPVMFEVVT